VKVDPRQTASSSCRGRPLTLPSLSALRRKQAQSSWFAQCSVRPIPVSGFVEPIREPSSSGVRIPVQVGEDLRFHRSAWERFSASRRIRASRAALTGTFASAGQITTVTWKRDRRPLIIDA
jgi:hypothetical protein